MGLNIKNERVHALARQAARVTGRSQTSAIEEALERLLRDYGADPEQARVAAKVDLVHRIVLDYQADPGRGPVELRDVEDLFEPTLGLPR